MGVTWNDMMNQANQQGSQQVLNQQGLAQQQGYNNQYSGLQTFGNYTTTSSATITNFPGQIYTGIVEMKDKVVNKVKELSNLEWLDSRINEMRVAL